MTPSAECRDFIAYRPFDKLSTAARIMHEAPRRLSRFNL